MTHEVDFTARMVGVLPVEMMRSIWGEQATALFADVMQAEGKHTDEGPLSVMFQFMHKLSRSQLQRGAVVKDGKQIYTLYDNGDLWLDHETTADGEPFKIQFIRLSDHLYIHHLEGHPVPGEVLFQIVELVP